MPRGRAVSRTASRSIVLSVADRRGVTNGGGTTASGGNGGDVDFASRYLFKSTTPSALAAPTVSSIFFFQIIRAIFAASISASRD
jgi:hypothetical protein